MALSGEKEIGTSQPLAFRYKGANKPFIRIKFPELTWKCKKQGYPDFARITIEYIPSEKALELKSCKLWLNRFRDIYISYEEIAEEIFKTLWQLLSPRFLRIHLDINPRGNMKTDIYVEGGKKK